MSFACNFSRSKCSVPKSERWKIRSVVEKENIKPFMSCVCTHMSKTQETLSPDIHTQELLDLGKPQWASMRH